MSELPERKVFFSIIHEKSPQIQKKEVPCKKTDADYAFIYKVLVSASKDGISSAVITNQMQEQWKVTTEQLHRYALKNTPDLFPARLTRLSEAIHMDTEIQDIMFNPWILTNENFSGGAAAMYYSDHKILRDLSDQEDCNLYVIPADQDEVLLLKEGNVSVTDADNFAQYIFKAVGQTELGNQALYYDRQENHLFPIQNGIVMSREIKEKAVRKSSVQKR
ncbi:MAG: DUF5688 family protein [Clostridiaceae bacterium]|nr:DUF5688 family protein [Clostridiaceae bacterium]